MSARYPASIVAFDYKVDNKSKVVAADVNAAYDEIAAIEVQLGKGGVLTSTGYGGAFNTTTTLWTSLKDRLQNIEYGIGGLKLKLDGGTPSSNA
jgi:hypothetical protein